MSSHPIFILGISTRSGTNFLYDLLRLHPDCDGPGINWEDSCLSNAQHLVSYIENVSRGWRRHGAGAEVEDLLYKNFGNGIISVLTSQIKASRLVTKAPRVQNLDCFFRLFPRAYLLILVRDGRAVVESRVKTFGQSYEAASRHWAAAAETILQFQRMAQSAQLNYMTLKYEDLCGDLENQLPRILAFLDLDPKNYDFAAAINLPVRGSSVFRGTRPNEYHWDPVEKTADFNPVARWSNWSRSRIERFNWIAGEKLVALGYEEKKFGKDQQLLWTVWNKALDVRWQLKELLVSTMTLIKNGLKWAFGAERVTKCQRQVLCSIKTIFNLRRALSHQ